MAFTNADAAYPARLEVDYPEHLNRLTTLLRIVWIIPIVIVYAVLTGSGQLTGSSDTAILSTTALGPGLAIATALMILFRRRYPRWWFDFARELTRFTGRVTAYFALLTDEYPSTVDEQALHIEIDYPDADQDLNRWLPLVKWLLAIPHYIVLIVLLVFATIVIIWSWFAILFTGHYPRGLFEFVVGVGRWSLRVNAYAFLLVTDRYPPFSLDP